ncbi:MAG: hypothetical protein PHY47_07290 [Lachnospiraceae bacterium]|nr:hypothetical protein [Lachnospiraceae bacterium]
MGKTKRAVWILILAIVFSNIPITTYASVEEIGESIGTAVEDENMTGYEAVTELNGEEIEEQEDLVKKEIVTGLTGDFGNVILNDLVVKYKNYETDKVHSEGIYADWASVSGIPDGYSCTGLRLSATVDIDGKTYTETKSITDMTSKNIYVPASIEATYDTKIELTFTSNDGNETGIHEVYRHDVTVKKTGYADECSVTVVGISQNGTIAEFSYSKDYDNDTDSYTITNTLGNCRGLSYGAGSHKLSLTGGEYYRISVQNMEYFDIEVTGDCAFTVESTKYISFYSTVGTISGTGKIDFPLGGYIEGKNDLYVKNVTITGAGSYPSFIKSNNNLTMENCNISQLQGIETYAGSLEMNGCKTEVLDTGYIESNKDLRVNSCEISCGRISSAQGWEPEQYGLDIQDSTVSSGQIICKYNAKLKYSHIYGKSEKERIFLISEIGKNIGLTVDYSTIETSPGIINAEGLYISGDLYVNNGSSIKIKSKGTAIKAKNAEIMGDLDVYSETDCFNIANDLEISHSIPSEPRMVYLGAGIDGLNSNGAEIIECGGNTTFKNVNIGVPTDESGKSLSANVIGSTEFMMDIEGNLMFENVHSYLNSEKGGGFRAQDVVLVDSEIELVCNNYGIKTERDIINDYDSVLSISSNDTGVYSKNLTNMGIINVLCSGKSNQAALFCSGGDFTSTQGKITVDHKLGYGNAIELSCMQSVSSSNTEYQIHLGGEDTADKITNAGLRISMSDTASEKVTFKNCTIHKMDQYGYMIDPADAKQYFYGIYFHNANVCFDNTEIDITGISYSNNWSFTGIKSEYSSDIHTMELLTGSKITIQNKHQGTEKQNFYMTGIEVQGELIQEKGTTIDIDFDGKSLSDNSSLTGIKTYCCQSKGKIDITCNTNTYADGMVIGGTSAKPCELSAAQVYIDINGTPIEASLYSQGTYNAIRGEYIYLTDGTTVKADTTGFYEFGINTTLLSMKDSQIILKGSGEYGAYISTLSMNNSSLEISGCKEDVIDSLPYTYSIGNGICCSNTTLSNGSNIYFHDFKAKNIPRGFTGFYGGNMKLSGKSSLSINRIEALGLEGNKSGFYGFEVTNTIVENSSLKIDTLKSENFGATYGVKTAKMNVGNSGIVELSKITFSKDIVAAAIYELNQSGSSLFRIKDVKSFSESGTNSTNESNQSVYGFSGNASILDDSVFDISGLVGTNKVCGVFVQSSESELFLISDNAVVNIDVAGNIGEGKETDDSQIMGINTNGAKIGIFGGSMVLSAKSIPVEDSKHVPFEFVKAVTYLSEENFTSGDFEYMVKAGADKSSATWQADDYSLTKEYNWNPQRYLFITKKTENKPTEPTLPNDPVNPDDPDNPDEPTNPDNPTDPDLEDRTAYDFSTTMQAIYKAKKQVYSGKALTPAYMIKIKRDGVTKTLIEGLDYQLQYEGNINAGKGKIYIIGINDYTGTAEQTFDIAPKSIKSMYALAEDVTVGEVSAPNVVLSDGGTKLIENQDYTVTLPDSYAEKKSTQKITITGIGNYTGIRVAKVKIFPEGKILSEAQATLDIPENGYQYDTKSKKPVVTVTYQGIVLKEKKDYNVSYKNNKNAGTASIIITGKKDYSGKKIIPFEINSVSSEGSILAIKDMKYTGNLLKPVPVVKVNGKKLKRNVDYLVTYTNNIHAGTATVSVNGIGNYVGMKCENSFIINPLSAKKISIKGTAQNLQITYKKQKLYRGYDYTVVEGDTVKGKTTITITGINDFTGSITKNIKAK